MKLCRLLLSSSAPSISGRRWTPTRPGFAAAPASPRSRSSPSPPTCSGLLSGWTHARAFGRGYFGVTASIGACPGCGRSTARTARAAGDATTSCRRQRAAASSSAAGRLYETLGPVAEALTTAALQPAAAACVPRSVRVASDRAYVASERAHAHIDSGHGHGPPAILQQACGGGVRLVVQLVRAI